MMEGKSHAIQHKSDHTHLVKHNRKRVQEANLPAMCSHPDSLEPVGGNDRIKMDYHKRLKSLH